MSPLERQQHVWTAGTGTSTSTSRERVVWNVTGHYSLLFRALDVALRRW